MIDRRFRCMTSVVRPCCRKHTCDVRAVPLWPQSKRLWSFRGFGRPLHGQRGHFHWHGAVTSRGSGRKVSHGPFFRENGSGRNRKHGRSRRTRLNRVVNVVPVFTGPTKRRRVAPSYFPCRLFRHSPKIAPRVDFTVVRVGQFDTVTAFSVVDSIAHSSCGVRYINGSFKHATRLRKIRACTAST